MAFRNVVLACLATAVLSGCSVFDSLFCPHHCRSDARASSSLVGFLYPGGETPPAENRIPELQLPLRVGLAFLPSKSGAYAEGLEAAQREKLLERIRERFATRKFVREIVIVPDYYLSTSRGFEGLAGVQRLYNVDIMALVSYDQVTYRDDNSWSLGYLTIVGAYVLKGTRHDVVTLMDMAVIDPASRSILLRAGGTDNRHGTTTLISESKETRDARTDAFSNATDQLIGNFDQALVRFETDVREGKANVRVAHRAAATGGGGGGGGALDGRMLAALLIALAAAWVARQAPRRR